jgi:hypothetical protein
MRWRDMHDDVSRALSSMRPNSEPYTTSDSTNSQRAQVDPEDFGANTEKAAKKLKSLDEEYEAKNLKRQEMYASQDPDVYKQYWGTLRDVYNPKKPLPSIRRNEGGMVGASSFKESAEDSTTPDDTGKCLLICVVVVTFAAVFS